MNEELIGCIGASAIDHGDTVLKILGIVDKAGAEHIEVYSGHMSAPVDIFEKYDSEDLFYITKVMEPYEGSDAKKGEISTYPVDPRNEMFWALTVGKSPMGNDFGVDRVLEKLTEFYGCGNKIKLVRNRSHEYGAWQVTLEGVDLAYFEDCNSAQCPQGFKLYNGGECALDATYNEFAIIGAIEYLKLKKV